MGLEDWGFSDAQKGKQKMVVQMTWILYTFIWPKCFSEGSTTQEIFSTFRQGNISYYFDEPALSLPIFLPAIHNLC